MVESIVMKRKIYDELLEWKHESQGKTAALVTGARRVGKSFVVEDFARREYKSYVLLDFNHVSEDVKRLFIEQSANLDNFFMMLSRLVDVTLYERESVLIFDEVQQFPKARELIKYLVADRRYDYIETGSLMSIKENTKDIMIPSEEFEIKMHPLDFEEFLMAIGEKSASEGIREFYETRKPLGPLHRKYMTLFRQYIIVGGMPQAVLEFVETKDYKKVDNAKRTILKLYDDDIYKHGGKNNLKISQVYSKIPAQLSNANKRFMFSEIGEDARYREYEEAVVWLSESRIVNLCFDTTEPTVGLATRVDTSNFKCFQADTGLLISQTFSPRSLVKNEIYGKLFLGKLEFNNGMIMENVVAQMLVAAGHDLYYYFDGTGKIEADFLIVKDYITSRHNILPVEVKSGKKYTLRSIQQLQEKYAQQVGEAIVLHDGDLKVDEERKTLYLPLYMAGLL